MMENAERSDIVLTYTKAFSGFAVPDIEQAKQFYEDTLGLRVTDENGLLTLHLEGGDRPTLIYPKPDHEPANYTILNFQVDDVEQAVDELNEFENQTCGTEHEPTTPPEGASREVESGATEVDVTASDYAFDMPATLGAGRTSFVLTNQGSEAHFLLVVKLAEGAKLEDAVQSEDDSMIEGIWETGIAAPGGDDDEVITFDLEPGNYGALCFIPGPDGTPHAFMGMQKEFTVS